MEVLSQSYAEMERRFAGVDDLAHGWEHVNRVYTLALHIAEQHVPDDHKYMLDHFITKLLILADTMATETGRTLAQQRTAFMHSYLNELRKELEE